jgi:hypothetical protein
MSNSELGVGRITGPEVSYRNWKVFVSDEILETLAAVSSFQLAVAEMYPPNNAKIITAPTITR